MLIDIDPPPIVFNTTRADFGFCDQFTPDTVNDFDPLTW